MLEVINASKTFAKGTPNEHKALDHLNLSLKEGEFVTILGSNGAGKSTLFNAICGNFLLDAFLTEWSKGTLLTASAAMIAVKMSPVPERDVPILWVLSTLDGLPAS